MKSSEKLNCYLCETPHFILIEIKAAGDSPWIMGKGICLDCFKNGDLDELIFTKHKKFITEQIEHHEEAIKTLQKEL